MDRQELRAYRSERAVGAMALVAEIAQENVALALRVATLESENATLRTALKVATEELERLRAGPN